MRIRRHGSFLSIETPAKLNLFLEVLGRRDDGYHELETVMASVGLYDTLRFLPDSSGVVSLQTRLALSPVDGHPQSAPCAPGENLVLRAAELLRTQTGATHGAAIELIKRSPWQSGLGGASSDAAATLVGLNELWGLNLSTAELHHLAAKLGSDVNFFLSGSRGAICRGRGEKIEPIRLPLTGWFVIAQPKGGLSTAEVFRRWSPADSPRRAAAFLEELRAERSAGRWYNALLGPARTLHPGLEEVLHELGAVSPRQPSLTGSGSACFALFGTHRDATRCARRLRALQKYRVSVAACRT